MFNVLGSLGVATSSAADAQAWSAYISAANADVQEAWAAARSSYLTLKSVRAKLGLPFITSASGESGGDDGGWSEDLDAQVKDLQVMAKVLDTAAKDVASGKRGMFFDTKTGNVSIGGFNSDTLRIEADANGVPVLIGASGYPIHAEGTVSAVPVIVVAAAAGGLVQSVGLYLLAKQAMRTLETVSEHKTMRTLSNNQVAQIKQGATPAEAKANTDAIYQGAAALNKAQADKARAGNEESNKLADTAVKLGWLALIGGGLYVAASVISRMPAEAFNFRRASPAQLQLNPRMRMPQRGYGYVTPASNWRTTSAEHWDIEIVDDLIVQEHLGTRSLDGVTVDVWRALRRLPGDRRSQVFVAQTALGKA